MCISIEFDSNLLQLGDKWLFSYICVFKKWYEWSIKRIYNDQLSRIMRKRVFASRGLWSSRECEQTFNSARDTSSTTIYLVCERKGPDKIVWMSRKTCATAFAVRHVNLFHKDRLNCLFGNILIQIDHIKSYCCRDIRCNWDSVCSRQ